jgi:hypothetical protein
MIKVSEAALQRTKEVGYSVIESVEMNLSDAKQMMVDGRRCHSAGEIGKGDAYFRTAALIIAGCSDLMRDIVEEK